MDDKRLEIESHIFDFIYTEAMEDATRRTRAASVKKTVLDDEEIKNIVKEYASLVIAGKNPSFDEYEKKIEAQLQKRRISKFTFGNIQKMMNMTMKYLYIRYYNRPEAVNFNCCDAPMDSVMRDYVYNEMRKMKKKPDFPKDCAWSKLKREKSIKKYSYSSYANYQDAVDILRGGMSRLEYEIMSYNKARLKK